VDWYDVFSNSGTLERHKPWAVELPSFGRKEEEAAKDDGFPRSETIEEHEACVSGFPISETSGEYKD
jgi:hypothetical protein